jgi:glutaredoxin
MSIVLYVLKGCPYCNNALILLKENNIKHKAIVVEEKDKEKYKKLNKMDTFPQIFINVNGDNYFKIGGFNDLVETMEIVKTIMNSNVSLDSVYYLHKLMNKKSKK